MLRSDYLAEKYPDQRFKIADGYDDAILGVEENTFRVVYSIQKVLDILQADGMTYLDAVEYFDNNIGSAYMGKDTPIWVEEIE